MPKPKLITSHELPSGQRLQVRHGDITKEQTECIVNAANAVLRHGSGVAGAIKRAGGDSIQEESDRFIRLHGAIENGGVAVTGAGQMPFKAIVHAVGPIWKGNVDGIADKILAMAVWNSLKAANEAGLDSIALPAISSGVFGFPKPRCARIMVAVALEYFKTHEMPHRVSFTNYDEYTVNLFVSEFERRFGDSRVDAEGQNISIRDANEIAIIAARVGGME